MISAWFVVFTAAAGAAGFICGMATVDAVRRRSSWWLPIGAAAIATLFCMVAIRMLP